MLTTIQECSDEATHRNAARHSRQYKECNACPLSKCRSRVVLYRGILPCEVLFIGEAPGHSEDHFGRPFVGEAGRLLQEIIDDVTHEEYFSYALTNIVACLPTSLPENDDADNGSRPLRDPTAKEAEACSIRLSSFIMIAKPKLIVPLGRIALKYLPLASPSRKIVVLPLIHPSAILQKAPIPAQIETRNFRIRLCQAVIQLHAQKDS